MAPLYTIWNGIWTSSKIPCLRDENLKTKDRPIIFVSAFLFVMAGIAAPALALDPATEKIVINYAYLADFGIGTYSVDDSTEDRQVRAFQIPFSYQLRRRSQGHTHRLRFPILTGWEDNSLTGILRVGLKGQT